MAYRNPMNIGDPQNMGRRIAAENSILSMKINSGADLSEDDVFLVRQVLEMQCIYFVAAFRKGDTEEQDRFMTLFARMEEKYPELMASFYDPLCEGGF